MVMIPFYTYPIVKAFRCQGYPLQIERKTKWDEIRLLLDHSYNT